MNLNHYQQDYVTIHHGSCLEVLPMLPEKSVHCCVTSPPYFGLRDYGVDGQIGLEATPDEYVAAIVTVFREVWRVLRGDGTVWLNLGDSYAGSGRGGNPDAGTKQGTNRGSQTVGVLYGREQESADAERARIKVQNAALVAGGMKSKDLIGIPWRVAFALQADGWYLRSDIIWAKPNPMPESVTDRPTKSHEYIFLLTKSQRYFYDADAIAESSVEPTRVRSDKFGGASREGRQQHSEGGTSNGHSTRNKRTVWSVTTQPCTDAHFAVFPQKLIEPCILAGTSERGCCADCGAPWKRVVEKALTAHDGKTESAYEKGSTANRLALLRQAARERGEEYSSARRTIDWKPTCTCNAEVVPCTVLDPFMGSGTTALVAKKLCRRAIGIEANAKYIDEIATRRLGQPCIMFD